MSDQSKIRLVRCPKCENLLQELTDYSVYQCGGCGTVLRAKNVEASEKEKLEEQKVEEISVKFPEKMEDMYVTESNVEKSCGVENDHSLFDKNPELDHAEVAEEFDDSKPSNSGVNAARNQRSRRVLDSQMRENRSFGGDFRSSASKFREESSSSSYQMKRRIEPSGFNKIEHLEQDRAELLRKLDELKEQINRTCDVADNPSEKILLDRRAIHQDPYNIVEPQYGNYPYRNENFYPSLHSSNHVNGARVPFRSQMLNRVQNQEQSRFQNYPDHSYFPHHDIHNVYQLDPYPNSSNFHQPSCTCFHCYHNNRIPNNPMFYHQNKPRFAGIPSMNPKPGSTFVRHQPHKVVLVPNGRKLYPVSGGAPFLTCFNCFELLQFPKNLNQKKIICGGCSTAIFIKFSDNKLIVSGQSKTNTNSDDVVTGGNPYTNGHVNWASTDFSSDEYDFQSTDRKLLFSDPTKSLADMTSLHSTSSCTTEEENNSSSGNLVDRRKQSKSAELPMKVNQSSPPEGSPLQEHFDYSNTKYNNLIQRLGKGNRSGRSEVPKKVTSRQNSIKDVAIATEIDIPSNEYGNTGISQESANGSKEESQTKVNKSQSFFTGIIKKSFKYSKENDGQEKANVIVNGQPIRDRLVKKAEKLAGSIQPGEYWYDFRAGFWGVMGGPCQGIIPPLIEEFNYPMPEKCAGGNTGVFVNGRELNKKDLDLLASRGLPTESDRSYILEISGRILDEDSGEELDCLGRLAPTVEKVKHGFGMKPPRTTTVS